MSDNKVIKKRVACQWCGKQRALISNLVCSDCYILLVRAGIKEEEIFKDKEKKKPLNKLLSESEIEK